MKKTKYRLDEQIRQAFLSLESKWTEKEIGFQVELEEVKYTGNEGLFMHIWMNLLDNAIKFSPAKGTITMFLKQEQDSVKFIVEDEGPGIEDDVKTRIFDKFYQVDGSHKAEGNGLGLALVKRIVDSAGGTIKAENREYGGCRFVVELPIQKDEAYKYKSRQIGRNYMTFYQELQLNQAGSKNLLKKSETRKKNDIIYWYIW